MSANKKGNNLQPPIVVPYKTFPGSGAVLWPVVEIRIKRASFSIPQPIFALVDSGASNSILHPFIAETLGYDLKKLGTPFKGTGVGGSHDVWVLPDMVEVNLSGYQFVAKFEVINNPRLLWPCILGQDTIFSFARIDFYKYKNFFELRFRSDIH